MTGGEGYAANHLSNSDYYAVGETVVGQWMGRGAELLGLEGAVKMEDFDAIRLARDPATGEFLRQRESANRFDKDGEKLSTGRNLYDFTVSAPKALSVLGLEDPKAAWEAHNVGVEAAAAELERLAGARIRKDNMNESRETSNMVISRWDHTASRATDPQIHSHLVAGNLTFDGVESRWKALDATQMYEQTPYLTEVYRNAAAGVLHSHGYQTYDRFEHGKDNGFGIVGIGEDTLEKFSRRTADKEAAIQEFIRENGRQPSKNEISQLVRETREPKLREVSTAELTAEQRARMSPEERDALKSTRVAATERGSIRELAAAGASLNYASEHLFERLSVAKEWEVKAEALRHGRARIQLSELKGAILAEVATGSMLAAKGEVATSHTLDRELRMVATVNEGIGKYETLGRGREFVVSDRLKPEQKAAVLGALASKDLAYGITGAAGAGKTTLLKELQRGLNEARRSVVAVGPSTTSVEELRKEGFPQATTIAELRISPQKQAELRGQVLIIDEAGMVGSGDMSELLKLAKAHGARILNVGDSRQIKSVQQGDALRILEKHSDMNRTCVLEVQRQTNKELKAAVMSLRKNPAEGFERLEKMGAIHEVHWRERGIEVTNAYRRDSAALNAKGELRSVLVVAATHEEIRNITHAIRSDLKRDGKLADGLNLTKHTALNWTEAQKKQTKNYQPGQVLEFHKAVKGVARKNESLEVISASKAGITARRENGEEVRITGKEGKSFGVFEKQKLEVSARDKLLLQANYKDKTFKAVNGELVTVANVEQGRIKLTDGREMPAAYKQFTHGYAVTAHRSQAKTVEAVIVAAERMSHDQFYVAVTRSRETATIITSDSLGLQQSIGVSADRQSAMELAQRAAHIAARPAAHRFEHEDYQLYQKFQEQQRPTLRPEIQKEMTRNASVERDHGISY